MTKILVVGLGSIGLRHVRNIIDNFPTFKIFIYTKRKKIPKEIKDNKNIVILNLIDDCLQYKPDMGFVTNESAFHIPISIKLANIGMDLFIEKPLSNSFKDLNKLNDLIKKNKLITQMGCNFRFFPPLKKIKQLIDKKIIGRVISVQVENNSYLPDYHPLEDYRKGYAAREDLGGGALLTQIHEIDYLYWLFGDVKKVSSFTGKFSDLEVTADDMSTSLLEFENGVIGQIHISYFQRPYFRSCKIKGTKGIIEWNSIENEVNVFDMKSKNWKKQKINDNYKLITGGTTTGKTDKKLNQMYVEEIKHFMSCVKKRKETINDFKQGEKILKIALSMKESSKRKKIVLIK